MQQLPVRKQWGYVLVRVLLFCVCCAVILAAISGLAKNITGPLMTLIVAAAATVGSSFLTLLFVRWEKVKLNDVGFKMSLKCIPRFLTGVIVGLFLAAFQAASVLFSEHIKWSRSSTVTVDQVLISFIVYLLLACREEVSFRGYPLFSLNRSLGPWKAQLIVALVFAIEHMVGGMSWWQALIGTGVGSLLFGIAALTTRGLAVPIGIHAAWNFGQWLFGFKDGTGVWHVEIDKGYDQYVQLIGMISYVIVMGMAIVAFYYYSRRQKISLSSN